MYELSILSDRAPLGDPPDLTSYPLLARPGSGQVGVLEAAFIVRVRERIEVDPQVLDSMVLTFEGERKGADSLVVRAWFCGERELVRLPVFGYSPAREVVGDVGDVASYVTAMWELLIFGWEQHVAHNVGRVQQTIAWKLKRVWATDPARLLDACEAAYPPHELWNEVLPAPWVPTHAPYWDSYQQLSVGCDRPQLGAILQVDQHRYSFEVNVSLVMCQDTLGADTHLLGRVGVDVPKLIPAAT
ncbi:MAG: hypothetical protein OXK16_07640 [bacterium]|nr:hypothetical protein [bacterium]